ncbi:MAG: glycine cleavage T C-terminal barrel domain-containing protein [Solirubrobacteraceae bacterium]
MLLYPRIRKSPYFDAARRHGVAVYSVYNHMYIPRHYGDPVSEYWHLLNGVTLADVGVERAVEISGPDALRLTNMLVTRDLHKCEVGQCKYVFLTTPEGGIVNDPVLLRLEDQRFWLTLADSDALLWVKGVAYGSDLRVDISEPDMGPVQVQGPKSKDVMVDLFGESILEIPYYFVRPYTLDGMHVFISRTGYSAELGYEIYLYDATRHGTQLWERLIEAGAPHDLAVSGVCHIRRIEAGILAYGADMSLDTNPFEVGMGYPWMVDLHQPDDFIGRDALARIAEEGPRRRLVGVQIDGGALGSYSDGSMVDAYSVRRGDRDIGRVTSACHSPRLEKNIGLALLATDDADQGTELEVVIDGVSRAGVVAPTPFVDTQREVPRQTLHAAG